MKNVYMLILIFLFGLFSISAAFADTPDNTLLKYYSAYLTVNLNHAIGSSKILYHLSKEQAFDKDFLETELNRIQQDIDNANNNIANIIVNTVGDQKKSIDKYLDNIDEHLAQVSLDLDKISKRLKEQKDFSPLISDIYYQVNKAENEDHEEISRILKLKVFDEPLLVKPEVELEP